MCIGLRDFWVSCPALLNLAVCAAHARLRRRISLSRPFFLPKWAKKYEAWKGFASWHALSAVALAKVEVPLHTAQPCFMHRRCASYIRLFRWSSSILFRYEALFRSAPQYEAFASLILWEKLKMRVCPLVIQYYPHYITARKGKLIMEKSSNKLVDLSVTFAVEIGIYSGNSRKINRCRYANADEQYWSHRSK